MHNCTFRNGIAKVLATALLATSALLAQATDYYVSPTGNDSNNGTSPSTAWKTIDRVNQLSFTLQPGDKVLFQRGGTWRGEVFLGTSGAAGQPITVGAYGSGPKPIIKGSNLVGGWTVHQGNIWKATVAADKLAQVYVGGQRMTPARYPNSGWLRNTQGGGTQLQSNDITQPSGYWNGAICVLRSSSSSFDTLRVTSQVNGTLHFAGSTFNLGNEAWGFFMRGKLSELDSPGEWFYDKAAQQLYLWAPGNANPNNLEVEAAVRLYGVWCTWHRHHMSVKDLDLRHQLRAGVYDEDADHVVVDGCSFSQLYHAILAGGTNGTYINNTIRDTYATAIPAFGNNALIAYNTLNNIAVVDGDGEHQWGYFGIRAGGYGTVVRGNRLDTIGYMGITSGLDQLIEKNVVRHTMATMNDGGGITLDGSDGLVIQDNIVGDPIGSWQNGSPPVAPHNVPMGIGIYFGNTSIKNTTVQRNTVYNCPQYGMYVDHTMVTTGVQVKDNTFFNNGTGFAAGAQLAMADYSNAIGAGATAPYHVPAYNDVYSGNVMYSLTKDQPCMLQYHCYSATPVVYGSFANNRYFNPYNELSIKTTNFIDGYQNRAFTLERWQAEKATDAGSTRSPLRLSAYSTVQELGSNLVANGQFTNNVNGWTGWPTNAQVSHVTNRLDNGALKANLPNNSMYPNFTLENPDHFPIQDNAWYRVRCSLQSDVHGKLTVGVKGEASIGNPYTTWQWDVPFSSERRDLEMYFQSNVNDQAWILFSNPWTDPYYFLDNVEVTRVQVQPLDPLERHKLFVNDQATAQSFPLPEGCWKDLDGNLLNGSIPVPPYSSKVVYLDDGPECDLTTSLAEAPESTDGPFLFPNPVHAGQVLHITGTQGGKFTLTDVRGTLVLDREISPGSTHVSLPEGTAPGLYMVRIQGPNDSSISKLVVR
ncbi:MAG: right-handed parallel beta-helix repeat-containing protein [Flavobacteriales bacterium]|nr:right-handed parallel beta-helix repeat-containing protein [Flavobacteriales bacterium]